MPFNFLSNEMAHALCWMLIHSLWQGCILAVATGIVMVLTRRSHPQKRYLILVVLFALFVLTAAITFIREYHPADTAIPSPSATEHFLYAPLAVDEGVAQQLRDGDVAAPWTRFVGYFNEHASFVVLLWFIVFAARLVGVGGSLVYIQRLRSYKVTKPGTHWLDAMETLAAKMAVSAPVKLMESGLLKVPVTIGVFKPVILLPLGLLTRLPADEVEAILLHELAHIRRRDYLINMMQRFTETVFFFNPALLWLSAMIREEREHCCDEMAIAVTHNKTNFINALLSFQEFPVAGQPFAMAFPGNKNQLLNRVKRIVHNQNKTLTIMEKSVLSMAAAAFMLFSFVSAKELPAGKSVQTDTLQVPSAKPVQPLNNAVKPDAAYNVRGFQTTRDYTTVADKAPSEPVVQATLPSLDRIEARLAPLPVLTDTLPELTQVSTSISKKNDERIVEVTARTKAGRVLKFKKVNDVLKELSIDGTAVPESAFSKYYDDVDAIEKAQERKREWAQERREEANARRTVSEKMRLEAEERKRWMLYENKADDNERKQQERRMREDMKGAQSDRRRAIELKLTELHRDSLQLHRQTEQLHLRKIQLEKEIEHFNQSKHDSLKQVGWKRGAAQVPDGPSERKRQAIRVQQARDEERRAAAATVMQEILADLAQENIIVDRQTGWFALDKKQFVVNGTTVPVSVHSRFANRYLRQEGMGYYYGNVKVSGKGIFLSNKEAETR